ncbi:MAG: penicillin acylase family protein, partial [Leptospiraceae bacterium]|nr:penicillin acylase family protein [Leptospiraceae bacterium]
MKKQVLLLLLFILFILFPVSFYLWLRSKVPNYSGQVHLKGLRETVEIRYDNFGIPKIFANNKRDLFFALGYAQARERLFQMQLMKRLISGRISEVVGERGITVDKYFRSIGLLRNSKKYFERNQNKFPREYLDIVYGYIEGVNSFIDEGEIPADMQIMGLKPERIDVEHILAFAAFMGLGFGEGVHADPVVTSLELEYGDMVKDITGDVTNYTLLTLGEKENSKRFAENLSESLYAMDETLDKLNIPLFQGSNSWVISGRKTRSGKPILSNDPHIGFSNPSIWFEAYLETSDLEIHGHFLPLIPIPVIGANSHHAWGLTMFENDDMDFYKETPVKGKEETHYLFQGKEYPYEIIEEEIQVKGSSPIKFQIKSTIHGPILNGLLKSTEELNFPVALRWTMFEDSNEYLKAFVGFVQSKSLKEFEESTHYLKTPGLNIVYADKDGNIAYFACGALYEKNFPTDRILDGASGKFEWGREIPVTQRPRNINPMQGYIFTANHKHFGNLP